MSDFARLSRVELEAMAACGDEAVACQSALARAGKTILAEALHGAAMAEAWKHYPAGDFYDPATHAQYFFHAHPPGERGGEKGHFHTFLRARGVPAGVRPLVMPELALPDNPAAPKHVPAPSAPEPAEGEDNDPWSHLIAVSLGASGGAERLFTTNRWVTGETWYRAADVALMLDRFAIGTAQPPRLLDRWITAMLGLFKAEIAELLERRDAAVMSWRRRRRGTVHVLEDRRLEVTSALDIDVDAQRRRIAAALKEVA
jgi:hypothetical protein